MDTKAHRKSRAPWQVAGTLANPYANTSLVDDKLLLQVPNPYAGPAGAGLAHTRKNTRRMSIHASAMKGHGFDPLMLPPAPALPDNVSVVSGVEEGFGDIETKISRELAHGLATEIDDYFKVLQQQKDIITRDLKGNINQNQKHILELTNDLQSTQDELLKLRSTSKELFSVLEEFKESAQRRLDLERTPSQLSVPRTRKDRLSVVMLKKMWASELQLLFKHVEGASKYIQAIPGRHVLAESGRWHEVNAGTWKATKTIHLFILNDVMLVATKKSFEQLLSSRKLQAIHLWPLHEVKMEAASPPTSEKKYYAIQVTANSLAHVYRTDRYDHFLKVMEAYKKGVNELLQKNRLLDARKSLTDVDGDDKKQLRNSLQMDARTPTHVKRQSADLVLQDISARVHLRNRSHDYGKAFDPNDRPKFFNELKTIEDQLDDVDMMVSQNKYLEAVGHVNHIEYRLEQRERELAAAKSNELKLLTDVIKLKIENRKAKVIENLTFDLHHTIGKLDNDAISQIIEIFNTFGKLHEGIDAYLHAMSEHLASTIGKLVTGVQGSTRIDIVNYLANLVVIHVAIIKRAISVYQDVITPIVKRAGDVEVDLSGFISWCVDGVTKLVESIKKHLYGTLVTVSTDPETEIRIYAVKDQRHFAEFIGVIEPQLNLLKSVGLNVDYLFDDFLSLANA